MKGTRYAHFADLITPHIMEFISNPKLTIYDRHDIDPHIGKHVPEWSEVPQRIRTITICTVLCSIPDIHPETDTSPQHTPRLFYRKQGEA